MTYMKTDLWKNAARTAEKDDALDAWRTLETAYEGFWKKSVKLAARISNDLPGLTLHDEAHLKAVWDTADLIAGKTFPMTPLEVFVFGGAVLLHDLGHTVTAYQDGLAGIKKTPAWRDAVLWRLDLADDDPDPSDDEIENPGPDIETAALFDTLRALHAEQAEALCEQDHDGPYGKISLIDDPVLRHDLGQLIGKIAASHHWDRETLRHRLRDQVGGIAHAPGLGALQPVKLACFLRCADACQIDQRRARDFDMALHRPKGVSKQHWLAQNRLALPEVKGDSILFTSTRDFGEDMADAWWVVQDLVQVAHNELQECEALMRDQGLPTLGVKGVAGASDVATLARHIRAEGWTPVDASLRVSDPRRMVEMFGGKNYYGKSALWVALRELLQNGIDAIEARRALEPGFEGRILVEQDAAELHGQDGCWLHVSDDGIGMSERVLTRTLVDFGRSAKTSGELQQDFPGLLGKRVPTIGQFGIGFFSVLMLSEHVVVQSRPYDKGHDEIRKLRFTWGGDSRPLLLSAEPEKLQGMSTRVSLFVEAETMAKMLASLDAIQLGNKENRKNESLIKLVQMVAPLPNCRIDVSEPDGIPFKVRAPDMYRQELALDWLTSVYADVPQDDLMRAAQYLTLLKDKSCTAVGWASINYRGRSSLFSSGGFRSEKGLCSQALPSRGRLRSSSITGVLPTFGTGPSRSIAGKPRGEVFTSWLSTPGLFSSLM